VSGRQTAPEPAQELRPLFHGSVLGRRFRLRLLGETLTPAELEAQAFTTLAFVSPRRAKMFRVSTTRGA
jgi:hypothetical protein